MSGPLLWQGLWIICSCRTTHAQGIIKPDDLESSRQHFDRYLASRGINGQLALYISKYAKEKEEQVLHLPFLYIFIKSALGAKKVASEYLHIYFQLSQLQDSRT
jgi:hypothetical protein